MLKTSTMIAKGIAEGTGWYDSPTNNTLFVGKPKYVPEKPSPHFWESIEKLTGLSPGRIGELFKPRTKKILNAGTNLLKGK